MYTDGAMKVYSPRAGAEKVLLPWREAAAVPARGPGRKAIAGMTLVEVLVAFTLFMIMAMGILAAMVQTRKISENNAAQAIAVSIAQGIIEQVQLIGYTNLTNDANLPLKFTGQTGANLAGLQQFSLPWAADATTFTDIGALTDPTNPASAILGVMLDFDYRNGATVVRPARYMKMRVNLQRTLHTVDDNVEIILTYSWQLPTGNGSATGRYLTREIRTIRSQAPSF